MNRFVTGLSARFFNVTMPTGGGSMPNATDNILSNAFLDLHAVGASPIDLDHALRSDIALNRDLVNSIGLNAD